MEVFVYFSQLMGRSIIDKNGAPLGKLYDIVVTPRHKGSKVKNRCPADYLYGKTR